MARIVVDRGGRGLDEGVPTSAVVGSLVVHAGLLSVMIWGTSQIAMPSPLRVYRVELVAAPRPAPVRTVPVPDRPKPAEEEAAPRPVETKPKPEPAPKRETRPAKIEKEEKEAAEEPDPAVVEEKPAAPPEQAVGGADVAIRIEGAPFPYPEYLQNIILQIDRHWRQRSGGRHLRAEVAFTILEDGSIEDIAWVRRSGSPAFDLEARGAIEAAGRRGAFGKLPEGYPADHLRISFFFDPTRY